MARIQTLPVRVGDALVIGAGHPIVVQTMCNTHTSDVEATVAQTLELAAAGAQLVRITVPGRQDVPHVAQIKRRLREAGCNVPLVADIHFSSETAIEVAPVVEKVRINPGNFHPDHEQARAQFARFLQVCKEHGTAVRVGLNHGSLGRYITDRYGNTPHAMAMAAMEWLEMCIEADFLNVVVSLKASNTVVMVEAYRELARRMQERGVVFPMHLGVTEAGGGDSGRIKSCVGIASLLQEGIGDTIRVSLTEPPVNELPVAQFLANSPVILSDSPVILSDSERSLLDAACTWGPKLLKREIDEIPAEAGLSEYLVDEIMQAARRRFYKPEYIACPGCGRTMYNLQETFEEVQRRTAHLKGMVIAVMGCIVNGPGEMADADWGYVGEGGGKVTIYHRGEPVLRHIPDTEAIDELLRLIEADAK
ncbi:MAG: (E)-4-hydroxy-3-methylbut-2-enyl-diphosphate synthase [Bacteroidales bacterium]|nr:(E)-4-hydroxy-3-methylbut-2-enyl-diphosphate synthase [Bacteroidales bacterium]MBR6875406.1 (E)-4-hydroxy-3-methylbut-2-enyl-diphosphate synthase [Bacteroidales bacterium]